MATGRKTAPEVAPEAPEAPTAATTAPTAPEAPTAMLADGERVDPITLALLMSDKTGTHKWAIGRKVSDKRVRSVARDTLDRIIAARAANGRTPHEYDESEADALVAAMRGRGSSGHHGPSADTLRERLANKSDAS